MRTVIAMVAMSAALASVARAQPTPPVQWSGPDDCPSSAALIGEIERLLGGDVDWSRHAALGAVVEATRDERGWRVVLTTQQPEGFRELRGATCKEVADAAALVIAMLVDPEALLAAEREPPPPAEPAPTEPAGDDELPTPPAVATAARAVTPGATGPRVRWSMRANVVSDLGALPGVVPGLGATAAGAIGRWRAELAATYWFERRERATEDATVGGDFSMWTAAARGCYGLDAWHGCAGLELGRFAADGFGTEQPRSSTATWLAPTLGLGRSFNVSKQWSFVVTADTALALRRPRFKAANVAGQDEVVIHRPAPVVGRVLVGAELTFP